MALAGELKGLGTVTCSECLTELPLIVCTSAAGHYLGHTCPNCGPYSRETGYFSDYGEATKQLLIALTHKQCENIRDTNYHPGKMIAATPEAHEEIARLRIEVEVLKDALEKERSMNVHYKNLVQGITRTLKEISEEAERNKTQNN